MCGIFAVHGLEKPAADRSKFIAHSKKQRHRGPDWSACYVGQRTVLVHERLAIVGVGELVSASVVFSIDEHIFRYRRAATFQRRREGHSRR
jgi:asparagine synthetase B (glutamine-hydrolysing)